MTDELKKKADQNPDEVEWVEVTSSNIARVKYLEEDQILYVQFMNGGIYRYFEVPLDTYQNLVSASSVGSTFYHTIRKDTQYNYEQVT